MFAVLADLAAFVSSSIRPGTFAKMSRRRFAGLFVAGSQAQEINFHS